MSNHLKLIEIFSLMFRDYLRFIRYSLGSKNHVLHHIFIIILPILIIGNIVDIDFILDVFIRSQNQLQLITVAVLSLPIVGYVLYGCSGFLFYIFIRILGGSPDLSNSLKVFLYSIIPMLFFFVDSRIITTLPLQDWSEQINTFITSFLIALKIFGVLFSLYILYESTCRFLRVSRVQASVGFLSFPLLILVYCIIFCDIGLF